MYKIITGIVVLVSILIAGWFFLDTRVIEYVATVDEEVSQLESELASLEASIAAGTLSTADAVNAQTKIVERIDAINKASLAGQKAQLTDSQRIQLINSLGRLKQALIKYKSTLVAVDKVVLALPESERPRYKNRGSGKKVSVVDIATEAIENVEEQVEDIIEDITDEDIIDDLNQDLFGEVSDDTASSTENDIDENKVEEPAEENGNGTDELDSGTIENGVVPDEIELEVNIETETETTTN